MKIRNCIAAAALALTTTVASADSIDLSVSNDTVLGKYVKSLSYSGYGHTDMDFGLMYTESDDLMGLFGITMAGEAGSHAPGLNFGVGARVYALTLDDADKNVGSVTLGGKISYIPPQMNRVGFVGTLDFGPDVTTFGDADRFWAFDGRVEFEVLPEAAVYAGYRKIRARLDNGIDADLDKGGHLGVRMSF